MSTTLRKTLQLWDVFSFLIAALEDKSEGVTELDSVERMKLFFIILIQWRPLSEMDKKMIVEKKEKENYSTFI